MTATDLIEGGIAPDFEPELERSDARPPAFPA
jgi:hypothetical protein